jgi:Cu(I)/Ag(I) efflux system membrane protein CusA/SilA
LQVGPAASSTGWVFQYVLVDRSRKEPPRGLRGVQDRVLAPALAAIPGVAEVASVGGDVLQALVEVRPEQLRARGLAFTDVVSALRPAAQDPANSQQLSGLSLGVASAQDGASTPRIGDVAHLNLTRDMPTGVADFNGVLPAVGGIVVAKRDADPAALAERVERELEALRPRLPRGVQGITVYDRLDL